MRMHGTLAMESGCIVKCKDDKLKDIGGLDMWLFFSTIAIVTALFNVIWTVRGKEAKWFRFISVSFTALTICAFYSADANWVSDKDWSALLDVVPTMAKALWACTIASIVINSVSLFKKPER